MAEENYKKALSDWIGSLTIEEKQLFKTYHLDMLFSLKQVRVDYNFLRAACRFWDPVHHVFCFGKNEICPTPDEFSAILGFPTATYPSIPTLDCNLSRYYERFLGLTRAESSEIVAGRAVNLLKIVQKFRKPTANLTEQRFRRRALLLCLLNQYLFVDSGTEMGDSTLLYVVDQIECDCSPVPMILGETLACVDLVRADPKQQFFGSPVLLQIWLQERLKLVEQPLEFRNYKPKSFTQRRLLKQCNSEGEWCKVMNHGVPSIRWVVPWWFLKSMIGAPEAYAYVRLFGLRATSYIFPWRILRQYGLRQTIPTLDTIPPKALDVRTSTIEAWRDTMVKLPRWMVSQDKHPQNLSKFYLEWMLTKTDEERLRARQAEAEAIEHKYVGMRPNAVREVGESSRSKDRGKRKATVEEKGKGKAKTAKPAIPRGPPRPTGVVNREPSSRPPRPEFNRERPNTWVRRQEKPSKFDRKEVSSSSETSPANVDPMPVDSGDGVQDAPKDDATKDAMAE